MCVSENSGTFSEGHTVTKLFNYIYEEGNWTLLSQSIHKKILLLPFESQSILRESNTHIAVEGFAIGKFSLTLSREEQFCQTVSYFRYYIMRKPTTWLPNRSDKNRAVIAKTMA